ncbi:tripartite motif-containing protein 16-like isoform X5 [Tachysurus fulvidraco]|uniref:tripartite motif-containing protein 16-like isoform X5 n=1 Tax=Tachysurus fulvidraco TaxID=1234273 RepID=UPI001FEF305E|nr:tripartite motif-containing protein 16-like isoform X5 [Tachysurus fulvidraco]
MAEAGISTEQDRFSCPVCQELLKDPVTTPCGHNFCKVCINEFWDKEAQRSVYSCPQCKETAKVVEEMKETELQTASPTHCYAGPGDVECDSCIGRKRKAVNSCLVCQASYCENHLQPHYQSPAFKKHKLVKTGAEFQKNLCFQHDKLMEIYCRTDQSFICYLCAMDQHKGHDTVSTKTERTKKQYELKEEQMKSQQKIQEKQKKVQELKQTVDIIKRHSQAALDDSERIFTELISSMEKKRSEVTEMIRAEMNQAERLLNQLEQEIADLKRRDTEIEQLSHTHDDIHFLQNELKKEQMKSQQRIQEKLKKVQELKQTVDIIKRRSQEAAFDSERIFNELISSMEKKRSEVTELIRAQEKAELSPVERLLNQLEQEIADLKRRVTEMEQLSHTHDDIHFLQSFPSLCVSPGCDDSLNFTVNQHLSFDGVRKSLSGLKKHVEQICEKKVKKVCVEAAAIQMILPSELKSRKDFLLYFRYLTLDPNTAHRELILSEKNRVVTWSKTQQQYPDHPERFDSGPQVLCKESVCGCCYWEVERSGVVSISVSYKEISRKVEGYECLFGYNNQSWSLRCSPSSVFFMHNNIETELQGPVTSRIGVYVDHSAGTLSFYSVSDVMRLLHRVHTTFTQLLYAGFWIRSYDSQVSLCDPK